MQATTLKRTLVDAGESFTEGTIRPAAEVEGRDVDPDAMAFIKAKRNVDDLQRAKKQEKRITH